MNNKEKLIEIVRHRFPSAAMDFEAAQDFAATGLDSLDFVDLIWEVEQIFSIKLSDADLTQLRKPADLLHLIEARQVNTA
jgi:acyl carrier protein